MRYLKQIAAIDTLARAFRHVLSNRGGPGVDGVTLDRFAERLAENLAAISRRLLEGNYRPGPALGTRLAQRTVYTLNVADRTLVQAFSETLAPPLESHFHDACYSYRPGRSAVEAAVRLQKRLSEGRFSHLLRCDVHHFFDSVDHQLMVRFLGWAIGEDATATLAMLARILEQPRLLDGQLQETRTGLCQGSPLSPLLSNLYLTPLDRYLEKSGREHLRFSDDLSVLLQSEEAGRETRRDIEEFLDKHLRLQLHPEKSQVVSFAGGFEFLGFHFSPAGRYPAGKAVAKLRERMAEAGDAEERREVARRWESYYGKDRAGDFAPGSPSPQTDEPTSIEQPSAHVEATDVLEVMMSLFRGNPNCFARAYRGALRYGYTPVNRPLTSQDLVDHLFGKQALGIYLLRDDRVACTCLDIDIDRRIMDTCYHNDAGRFAVYADRALQYARRVQKLLRRVQVDALLEDSGYKGYHVWIFLEDFVPAEAVVRLWRQVLGQVGAPPDGIKREVFPRETAARGRLGPLIKLPLAVHPGSGGRSMFLDDAGAEIANPRLLLCAARKVTAAQIAAVAGAIPAACDEIERLLTGCNTVAYLCRKAQDTGELGHFERTVLLYTIGQLGEQGARYLHRVLNCTRNYDSRITQRYLDKKHPSPIGCARIQEIMGDELERIECRCAFDLPAGGYASPLLHVFADATRNLARRVPRGEK